MNESIAKLWSIDIIEVMILAGLMLVGQIIKRKVALLNRFLLPTAIIAGFLGLALGPSGFKLIPLSESGLGFLVYHLLAVGFISLSLQDRKMEASGPVIKTGFFIVAVYLLQGLIGLGITMALSSTVDPSVFPSIGLLLPLGFGQGPGQAYSVGTGWEAAGIGNAASLGLTMATIGFIWATIGGVAAANALKRRYPPAQSAEQGTSGTSVAESGKREDAFLERCFEDEKAERSERSLGRMIDLGTRQFFLIGAIYLAVYGTLSGLSSLLAGLGPMGENLATTLWGFHFVFGAMYAILVRMAMNGLSKAGMMRHRYTNNRLLGHIAGTSFDFMVCASIAAISLQVVADNWLMLLVVTTVGGLFTLWFCVMASRRVFGTHVLEHSLAFFGTYTGTLSTGIALLRSVDPRMESPVSDRLVLGSGVALFMAFPLLIILNLPPMAAREREPMYHLTALVALAFFAAIALFFLFRRGRKRREG